jgi:trimethylamine--corrinoid protein Co-methyltransferase
MAGLAGANLIYGMGMLDMGMVFSYTQLLVDHEIARMIRRTIEGLEVSDETMALDLVEKVGIGGNYITQKHTMKFMRTEQLQAELMDRSTRGNWEKSGQKDIVELAREKAVKILAEHQPVPLDEKLVAEFDKIIAKALNDE